MTRQEALDCFNTHALANVTRLYRIDPDGLAVYPDSVGCRNLVFGFRRDGREMILRASFRLDRPLGQVQAEVHFIDYLANGGMRVSRAVPSEDGNQVESLTAGARSFIVVAFEKAPGMRLPDNGYRYREGISIDEYFRSWGRALGKMHALARNYVPPHPDLRRPAWLQMHPASEVDGLVPDGMPVVKEKLKALLAALGKLPTPADAYGLIHADFNDGNFCVDYADGGITVFDFDDSCYGWFAGELADAWHCGVGWTRFEPDPRKRQDFMRRYMEQVLLGYSRENTPDPSWPDSLPFFLEVTEMDDLMSRLGYAADNGLPLEDEGEITYLVRCVEEDIPYRGLYDPIFSPADPFSLE